MGKREPHIILKTDERKVVLELGLEGKFAAKSTGWDEKPGLPRRGPGWRSKLRAAAGSYARNVVAPGWDVLANALDAVHPGQVADLLKGADRLAHRAPGAGGSLGDSPRMTGKHLPVAALWKRQGSAVGTASAFALVLA
jgi:hypothetical protein